MSAAAKLPDAVRHSQASGALVRRLPVVLLTLLATSHASAQIVRAGSRLQGPAEWISFGTAKTAVMDCDRWRDRQPMGIRELDTV